MSDIENARTSQNSQTQFVQNYDRQDKFAPRSIRIANPSPLGLFSFASTTFILSMYNLNARDIHTPNVIVGMACFCGGLSQFMAGMWEFPRGNVFGATACTSFGAFWMSYATILIPGSGVISSYASKEEFSQALGIYLMAWFILSFMLFIGTLRLSVAYIAMLFFLWVAFLLLAIGAWYGNASLNHGGGVFGLLTASVAYYCALNDLVEGWFTFPMGAIKQKHVD